MQARLVLALCLSLCSMAALAVAAPPVAPVIQAPFTYTLDNYLSDDDSVSSISAATTMDNSLSVSYAAGGIDILLVRTDLQQTFSVQPQYGSLVCTVGNFSAFDTNLTWPGMQFLDQVYFRGRLANHFQMIYPDDRRIGLYIDAETGFPVRQEPTFQFATMVWDYWNFSTSPIADAVFAIPESCKNSSSVIYDDERVENHILNSPHLNAMYGARVEFNRFKRVHNKVYESDDEHERRFHIFRKNRDFINAHNADRTKTYKLGINHLADLEAHEMKAMRGRYVPQGAFDHDVEYVVPKAHADVSSLPSSLDWRDSGAVGLIRNQGMCGSCWSFAGMEALEGAYFLKSGKYITLSPQNMVDCAWKFNCTGCDGCTARLAYELIQSQGGVASDVAYSYIGVDGMSCHYTNATAAPGVQVKNWQVVPSGNINAMYSAIQKGPLTVAIDAEPLSFNFYVSGVYNDVSCLNGMDDLDHEVLVAGYGVENGQAYWIVKNSWGHLFGVNGYIQIAVQNNICGVSTDAVLPAVV